MNLGKSIKWAMLKSDVKVKDVGEGLGIHPQQVNTWIRTGSMNSDNIKKLAAFFDMKVSEFIRQGEDEK